MGGEAGVGWHGNLIASSPLFMGITVKLAAGQLDKLREERRKKLNFFYTWKVVYLLVRTIPLIGIHA